MPESNTPGTNTGHGHAWARPDGVKAKCGGPTLCAECQEDEEANMVYLANLQNEGETEGE